MKLTTTLIACAMVATVAIPTTAQERRDVPFLEARDIHDRLLTLDTHIDIGRGYATAALDPGRFTRAQVDLPKMEEGGLNAGFWIVYVGQTERTLENYAQAKEQAMAKFYAIHRMTDEMYPDRVEMAYTADDAERIHESGIHQPVFVVFFLGPGIGE